MYPLFWWYRASQPHHNEADSHCSQIHPARPDIHICSPHNVGCISEDTSQLVPLLLYICRTVLPGLPSEIKTSINLWIHYSLTPYYTQRTIERWNVIPSWVLLPEVYGFQVTQRTPNPSSVALHLGHAAKSAKRCVSPTDRHWSWNHKVNTCRLKKAQKSACTLIG